MASAAQIAANRRNALKSTGPRTALGKQRSLRNACRHGLRSQALFLPGEDPRQFGSLLAAFHAEHHPSTPAEHLCLFEMTVAVWKILRADRAEHSLLQSETVAAIPELARILIARSEFLHRFLRALNRLLDLQDRPRLLQSAPKKNFRERSQFSPSEDWPENSDNHCKNFLSRVFQAIAGIFKARPTHPASPHPLH